MVTKSILVVEWERLAEDLATHLGWLEKHELDAPADDVAALRRKIAEFDNLIRKEGFDA